MGIFESQSERRRVMLPQRELGDEGAKSMTPGPQRRQHVLPDPDALEEIGQPAVVVHP